MKKQLLFSAILICLGFSVTIKAQVNATQKLNPYEFDAQAALQQAKDKGLKATEWNGYVNFLKNDFSSQQALKKETHNHTPYEAGAVGVKDAVIYLSPNKTASTDCNNMGFENYNFVGWTGGKGTVSTGVVGGLPIYTSTGTSIINTAGPNVSAANTINYHTIMTIPATNSVVPNHVIGGYDSLAVRTVGGQQVAEIPVVSPYSFDGVSVRMNSNNGNLRACKLKYITTTSVTNKRITFSYALVLNDPTSHTIEESPYFRVEVKNETTGAILPGCTSYTFNPKTALPSDSLKTSNFNIHSDVVKYRKWQLYSVDLSSLPLGTNVSLNFEVGGCTQGAHTGYAYVDAECGGLGVPYVNLCGSNFATLVAPAGFNSYQWIDMQTNTPLVGATNDTLYIPTVTTNTLYAVQMVSPGGCTLTVNDTIKATTVNIININSSASCAGGASGSANVVANGSNGIYTYTWVNTATGAVVSNLQSPTNLAAGNYSVTVASTSCGFAIAAVSVPVAPPFYLTQTKGFCGNSTSIAMPGGSNYQWYNGSGSTATLIAGSAGTSATLQITPAVNQANYTLVYTTSSGCKDSVKYTLNLIPGGTTYISNTQNVCPGGNNGAANINLNTPFASPYVYNVSGPSGVLLNNISSTATVVSIPNLAAATYSYLINDSVCIYNGTFTVNTIQTNFTVTPTNSVQCFPNPALLNLNFGPKIQACGLSTSGGCSSSNEVTIGLGTSANSTTGYPAPYGNFYDTQRFQMLFTATELNSAGITAGKLTSLSFNVSNINATTSNYKNYTIKLKCTSTASVAGVDNSGLSQVYMANSYAPISGWNKHSFMQAYEWDGTSNLLVDVCYEDNGALFTNNASSPYTATTFTSVVYYRVDNATNTCGSTNITNRTSNRPNIKFENCAAVNPANYTVTVSSNGTITANFNNDSIVVAPTFTPSAGSTTVIYTLTVVNPIGGCTKTQTIAIVYPSGKLTVNSVANPTVLCEGSSSNLIATGGISYEWYYGSVTATNTIATTQSITVTPPMVGNNAYFVIGSSSCLGTVSDTSEVIVKVVPKANLVIAPLQDVTKCLNKSYVVTTGVGSASSGNTGLPYSYVWTTLPGNNPAPGVNTTSSYTASANGTTTLVVTVNGVCANPTTDTIVIKNYVNNLALAIANSATVCANEELTLNTITNGGHPAYNYNWTVIPNNVSISNQQNLTINAPDVQGTYNVALSVIDSCDYTAFAYQSFIVLPPCNVIIPNVMSPNNDGLNDVFKVANIEHHPNTAVTIFDRWGKKIFESANYQNDWKADGVSDGTFFYVIDVPNDKKYNGFITIFHHGK